jgi:hypothetical protein
MLPVVCECGMGEVVTPAVEFDGVVNMLVST